MGEIASQLVRLNRKLAWLLVIVTAMVLVTGYGQSMSIASPRLIRHLHLIVEWLFVAMLAYHAGVGTLLSKYRYRSTLARMLRGNVNPVTVLRFALRVSSWPLLLLSSAVVLSGLSWRGRFVVLPFNSHVRLDAPFFILLLVHVAVGAAVALKRNWPRR